MIRTQDTWITSQCFRFNCLSSDVRQQIKNNVNKQYGAKIIFIEVTSSQIMEVSHIQPKHKFRRTATSLWGGTECERSLSSFWDTFLWLTFYFSLYFTIFKASATRLHYNRYTHLILLYFTWTTFTIVDFPNYAKYVSWVIIYNGWKNTSYLITYIFGTSLHI